MRNLPIGVFDSGVGGLTVLQRLAKLLPQESFVYLADQGFFPYGEKSFDMLDLRMRGVANLFERLSVKCLVVACNTASLHKDTLQKNCNFTVFDVIGPTCEQIARVTKSNRVALLGTQATVDSHVYQQRLSQMGIFCKGISCKEFVLLAERHLDDKSLCQNTVGQKMRLVQQLKVDTVIHGCTHFELLQGYMQRFLPKVNYVNCGIPTSCVVAKWLATNNLLNRNANGAVRLLTTGSAKAFFSCLHLLGLQDYPIDYVKI